MFGGRGRQERGQNARARDVIGFAFDARDRFAPQRGIGNAFGFLAQQRELRARARHDGAEKREEPDGCGRSVAREEA